MFTGLVACKGVIQSVTPESAAVCRISICAPEIAALLKNGESVAVAGVCLTVTDTQRDVFSAQVMLETLRASRLDKLEGGDSVNLERALRVGDRLDGHIVQGHVDEVGSILKIEDQGGASSARKFWISMTPKIAWGVAAKGSIAIDGVSLTVVDAMYDRFSVGLIPTTLRDTTIGDLKTGDPVNIEIDVMARYIARMLSAPEQSGEGNQKGSLTWEKLNEYGWA